MKKYNIAIRIQSEVQFFSLKPLLDELKKSSYDFVILVDEYIGNGEGYAKMASDVIQMIKNQGYNLKTVHECSNIDFDLCLAAYMNNEVNAKCYLKYEYGTLNIKPNLTYIPEVLEKFHGFLCQSSTTEMLLSVYGKTFAVDNLRFFGKKRKKVKSEAKKKLLFAPTYNDGEDISELTEMIKNLKKSYYVIVKGHHGTEYLNSNKEQKNVLVDLADEYFDSSTNIADLILSVDVCLFGNSSAIAEALYAGVPCAIFAKDLDSFRLEDIHTTQYQLVEDGLIPYCDNDADVVKTVRKAMTEKYTERQKILAKKIFPKEFHTGVDGYMQAIKYFLEDPVAQDYVKLHDYNIKVKDELISENKKLIKDLNRYYVSLKDSQMEVEKYREKMQRKMHRVVEKFYNTKDNVFDKKVNST